ncbi:MAG TPA: hypothetical protein VD886_09890, partial [Herpetosiphonaceae bacterium]|nr:hypothetical protein [Herpetosiphonaceae bacterium]
MRTAFLSQFPAGDYAPLPEAPVVRDGETYFIMSSIAAHIDRFLPRAEPAPARYVTVQRTLKADKIADIGKSPLANPYEITGSFFRFCDPDPLPGLHTAFRVLANLAGVEARQLYFRTTERLGLSAILGRCGIPRRQIITWSTLKPLSLGPDRPSGEYVYIYAPHRHGFIPVAVLGFIPLPDGMAVDSAFFLERIAMMRENQLYPPTTSVFQALFAAIRETGELGQIAERETYLWAYAFRALVALFWDGAQIGHRHSGHVVKKLVRELAATLRGATLSQASAASLTEAAIAGLRIFGYAIDGGDAQRIGERLRDAINQASQQIDREFGRLVAQGMGAPLQEADLARLESERGLKREWVRARLGLLLVPEHGLAAQPPLSIKHAAYPFAGKQPVDILGILRGTEGDYRQRRSHAAFLGRPNA